jgi:hypothetical protein
MRGLDDEGDEFFGRIGDVNDIHLCARNHDVAHLHLGDVHHALDHGKRIGIEEIALVGRMQQLHQLFAVFRLAQQERRQAFEPTRFRRVFHNLRQG